jgi:hypothetical protein
MPIRVEHEIIAQQFPHITNSFPLFVAYLWVMSRFIDAIFSQCLWWQFSCFGSSSSSNFKAWLYFLFYISSFCLWCESDTAFQSWQFFFGHCLWRTQKNRFPSCSAHTKIRSVMISKSVIYNKLHFEWRSSNNQQLHVYISL